VSLIADSLKKAVKEKSGSKWEPDRGVNPVRKRKSLKWSRLATAFRVLLLIVFPSAILVYLISIGAFSLEEEMGQEKKAFVPKATAALTAPEKSSTRKNEKNVFKKVMPPYPSKKKAKRREDAVMDVSKEKAASSSSSDLKSASPVTPKIPPAVVEKKIVMAPPPVAKAKPVIETKAVIPEKTSTPEPSESKVEIQDHEIATKPKPSAELPEEPILEKATVLPAQKTAVAKKKNTVGLPVEPTEKPVAVTEPVVEQAKAPPKIFNDNKNTPEKLTIEIQKKNQEVASLPSFSAKPEISRTNPAGPENVFNNSDYYFNRGIFFQQAGDWEKALENYSQSEELDPNNPDTYNNKGVVLKEMGKYDRALDEFLRAIFLDGGYAKAYNNIGVVYFMKKNYPEAIRHYLKAIDLNPTNLEAFNNLAIIYKKQKEWDRARGILNRALSLDPDHPGTNYNLAVLYEESSEIKPALHFYRRFVELGAISYPSLVLQVKQHLEAIQTQ